MERAGLHSANESLFETKIYIANIYKKALYKFAQYLQTMKKLKINQNPKVELKFKSYPKKIKTKLNYLRDLIIETATEIETIEEIEETLKWGEPSYLVKKGSTLRMDWKSKTPNQYAMYFKCTSKLVPTFKAVYGDLFRYEKNRAILFDINDKIPKKELKECIKMTLTYHLIKNKMLLGAKRS